MIGKERPPKPNEEKLSKLKMASGVLFTKLELHDIAENKRFLISLIFSYFAEKISQIFDHSNFPISYVCLNCYSVEI